MVATDIAINIAVLDVQVLVLVDAKVPAKTLAWEHALMLAQEDVLVIATIHAAEVANHQIVVKILVITQPQIC